MRPIIIGWLLFLSLAVASCETPTFEVPQPLGSKNLEYFPRKITGTYQSLADNSLLLVTQNLLVEEYDSEFRYHKNLLDSTQEIKGIFLNKNETIKSKKIKLQGDTIIEHLHIVDTIFDTRKEYFILKKFRGHFFLNTRINKHQWFVRSLTYQKGKIYLRDITTKEDLDKLKNITETKEDTSLIFKPSRKQFKAFVKQNGFSHEEQFIRIKKS